MFSNIYIQQRIQKADIMRDSGKNPYANDAVKTISNIDFLDKYRDAKDSNSAREDSNNIKEFISGRVKLVRLMGKAAFVDIEDESGILQAYVSKNDLGSDFEE